MDRFSKAMLIPCLSTPASQVAASWPEVADVPLPETAVSETPQTITQDVQTSSTSQLPPDSAISAVPRGPADELHDASGTIAAAGVYASMSEGHSTLEVTPHDPIHGVHGDEGAIQEGHEYGLEAVEFERQRQVRGY